MTHWDVMSRILEKGNPINGFFQLLVLQKIAVKWTGYMQSIMEPRSMIQYFFIQIVQGLFLGLAFSKTQIVQGIVFFALLFPRPKTRCSRLGVTPDFLGNFFWYTLPKLAPTRKAAVQALWQELRQWYSDNAVENRMLTLTETMLRKKANSSPKVRSKAAEARALVPFGVWFLI